MRWFKHFNDARRNPKFRRIEKRLGEAGYARAFKLIEVVADRGGTGQNFDPGVDLKCPHTDLEWLAEELGVKLAEAKRTLDVFASVHLIEPEAWKRKQVCIPQMVAYRDEWTRKRQPDSGAAQEEHRSHTGDAQVQRRSDSPQSKSQSQSRVEEEKEGESESDNLTTAADATYTKNFSLKGRSGNDSDRLDHSNPWNFLGLDKQRLPKKFRIGAMGTPFELLLKQLWLKRSNGSKSEFAELLLQSCQDRDIEYPPALLRRKKEFEKAGQ